MSADDLLHAQLGVAAMPRSTWIWRPSIDGAALTVSPLAAIAGGSAAAIPLLLQTCAREAAMFALLAADAPRQADRVLTGYFGPETAAKLLAGYAARYPHLDEAALRALVMTDERYVTPTERLSDAQAAHGPVWRSRYDGPYTGLEGELARYAGPLTGAHGGDGAAIWLGDSTAGDGLSRQLHAAWGAFATTGDPGWAPYTSAGRPAMIFAPDGPRVEPDPFAPTRAAWSGLQLAAWPWWAHRRSRPDAHGRLTPTAPASKSSPCASCCYLQNLSHLPITSDHSAQLPIGSDHFCGRSAGFVVRTDKEMRKVVKTDTKVNDRGRKPRRVGE